MEKFVDLIFARDIEKIEKLVKEGTLDVNEYVSLNRSALSLAAACGFTDVMECLINLGADINLNDEGNLGYTPIEHAARENKIEALKLLIEKGVEIDKGNTIDSNALIGACIAANNEVLETLVKNGANINHVDNIGQSALHYICLYAKQWGSGTITQTINGVTTELENPRFKEHTKIFNTLLENGADVNLLANYGYVPLHLAAETDTPSFIEPLIKKGANVNFKNSKGFSPLHAACDRGYIEPASLLIDHGADINIVDNEGFTPILGATLSQNVDLVKLLLEKGAPKDIKAKINYEQVAEGDDALALAKKLNNEQLIELLK